MYSKCNVFNVSFCSESYDSLDKDEKTENPRGYMKVSHLLILKTGFTLKPISIKYTGDFTSFGQGWY